MKKLLSSVVVLAVTLLLSNVALAVNRYVAPGGNDGGNDCTADGAPCATIAHAVTQSAGGDTINLAAGTYREADLDIDIDISIVGHDQSDTIIDADTNSDGTGDGRVFIIDNGDTFELSNVTVRNGKTGDEGAGIFCDSSTMNISDCTFTGNEAGDYGGGVLTDCTTTITDSTFTDNEAEGGGGLGVDSETCTVTRCTFTNNTAINNNNGGAIFADGDTTIVDSIISNNTANGSGYGGGISVRSDTVIKNCIISNNTAGESGGGLNLENNSTTTIINSTISGNMANMDGGAISFGNQFGTGSGNLHNVTIYGNKADNDGSGGGSGGAIYIRDHASCVMEIENTIVAGNTLGGVADECFKGVAGTINSGGYNIFDAASASCDPSFGANDMLGVDVATIIDTTLADNGGLTETHALIEGSPALDAGMPAANGGCQDHTATALTTDQRGFTRPVNDRCDIGAFEKGTCGDGIVDFGEACDDGANNSDTVADACRADCSLRSCGDGVVDSNEECDDGNVEDGDGCASTCVLEAVAADDDSDVDETQTAANAGGGCMINAATASGSNSAMMTLMIAALGIIGIRRFR